MKKTRMLVMVDAPLSNMCTSAYWQHWLQGTLGGRCGEVQVLKRWIIDEPAKENE